MLDLVLRLAIAGTVVEVLGASGDDVRHTVGITHDPGLAFRAAAHRRSNRPRELWPITICEHNDCEATTKHSPPLMKCDERFLIMRRNQPPFRPSIREPAKQINQDLTLQTVSVSEQILRVGGVRPSDRPDDDLGSRVFGHQSGWRGRVMEHCSRCLPDLGWTHRYGPRHPWRFRRACQWQASVAFSSANSTQKTTVRLTSEPGKQIELGPSFLFHSRVGAEADQSGPRIPCHPSRSRC